MQLATVLNSKNEGFKLENEDSVVVFQKKKKRNINRNSYYPKVDNKIVKSL